MQRPDHRTASPADHTSLFCDIELAARIEAAESRLMADVIEAARRRGADRAFALAVAGGWATYAEPDSPYNKVACLGFARVPTASELDEIEAAFAERGAPTQIELAHLADPDVLSALVERGYRPVTFENVLGCSPTTVPTAPPAPGIDVRPSPDGDIDLWLETVTEAAMHTDIEGLPMEEFPRDILERAERDSAAIPGLRRYLAVRNGQPAGGASWRQSDGLAQLTGAATLPAHRRKGVQSALLSARLADAAATGCDLAVITTQPGSKSHQNAQRRGFDLLYTRVVLVR
jgi:GNAT superfamily N-acetyltransferase